MNLYDKKLKNLIVIILIMVTTFSTLFATKSPKAITLAVWNKPNTAIINDDGEATGFDPELFKALAPYLPNSVEIKVYKDKATSLEALRNKEVDALMSTLYTKEIDEEFDYSNIMVRHSDSILCSIDKDYAYQEYSVMNNKTVGYLNRGDTLIPVLKYLEEKLKNPKFIAFDTSQEIKDALEAHTIDLATFGMSSLDDYYQILDRFNALPTFYITREG